jgi:hypothetical protein
MLGVMAALHPARIVKTTVAVYVAALFATAPFTGTGPLEAAPPAAADAAAHMTYAPAGVEVDIITFAAPISAYDVAAHVPPGARVVSLVGVAADGGSAGITVPDGLPLAGALAALGPEVASLPVTSVAVARDGVAPAA